MSDNRWSVEWRWRVWTFGVVFGPEVYELHVGPLLVGRLSSSLAGWDDPRTLDA